jgi:hypothetical protein
MIFLSVVETALVADALEILKVCDGYAIALVYRHNRVLALLRLLFPAYQAQVIPCISPLCGEWAAALDAYRFHFS